MRNDGKVWNVNDYGAVVIDTDNNVSYVTLSEDKTVLGSALDSDGNLLAQLVDFDTYAGQIATFDLDGNMTDSYNLPESVLGYSLAVNQTNNHVFLGNIFSSDGEIDEFTPDGEPANVLNVGMSGEVVYYVQVSNDSIWFSLSNDADTRFNRIGRLNLTDDKLFSRAMLDQPSYTTFSVGSDGNSMWTVNDISRLIHFHTYVTPDDTSDTDNDGITDGVENAGPNNGDANKDGIQDSTQANVTTLKYNDSHYIVVTTSCESNFNVQNGLESAEHNDPAYDYPAGLVSFVGLNCGDPGSIATVNLYYYGAFSQNSFALRKWHDAVYSTITDANLNPMTIGGQTTLKASYEITDGGELDQDGVADGNIADPVGLGAAVLGAPNTGIKQHWILDLK